MLAEGGELRRAARVINKAWQANPHPDLAQVFADLRFGDAARDRLKRIEALAKKASGHIEGALALARAAIDAREYGKARAALASYLAAPTRRVALLMAELERAAANDEGRAREWIARALNAAPDPTWTADGHVSDRWLPVSPSGRFDAFEWRVPLTGIESAANTAPVIEPESHVPAPLITSEPPDDGAPKAKETLKAEAPVLTAEPVDAPPPHGSAPVRPKQGAVIPLVHAPDDPGPDAIAESEPQAAPQQTGWWKIFEQRG